MQKINYITAVIIEDEELPRLSLMNKLKEYHPDIQLLASCEDYDTGLIEILRGKPDIVFLDIHLQDKSGLQLLEQIQKITDFKQPKVIFTTAFSDKEYLMKAIRLSASDYLLKPIDIEELAVAIDKIRQSILQAALQNDKQNYSFRTFNSLLIVRPEDIICCKADGNYSEMILLHGKDELVFERLCEIEKKLDPNIFIRAGKSCIINKNYIYKLDLKNTACIFRTPEGKTYEVVVSEKVMAYLKSCKFS